MKRIFSSPNPAEMMELRHRLEGVGIACITRNEVSAGLIGEIPLNEATPELWIEDDSKIPEALRVKQDWEAEETPSGNAWTCPICGETSEPQFTSCWKCGTSRS